MKPRAPEIDASCHRDVVSQAQNGNEQALRTLYESTSRKIYRIARALVGIDHADDVAADVWVRILTYLRSYREELGDFDSWAAAIARNEAIDHLNRERSRRTVPIHAIVLADNPAPENTEHQALERITTHQTVTAVRSLPRDQAAAVLACVIIGMGAPMAARTLGKAPGAVRTAKHRGLAAIRARLPTAWPAASGIPDAAHHTGRHPGRSAPVLPPMAFPSPCPPLRQS